MAQVQKQQKGSGVGWSRSGLRIRQMISNTRFALQGRAVECLYALCAECNEYIRYEGHDIVKCAKGHLTETTRFGRTPLITSLYMKCNRCNDITNLESLKNVGFFLCLHCIYKPKFDEMCIIIHIPAVNEINGIPIESPREYSRQQFTSGVEIPLRAKWYFQPLPNQYPSSTEYFYPSLHMPSQLMRQLIGGKLTIHVVVWFCVQDCKYMYNEFLYVTESQCVCGRKKDTSNIFSEETDSVRANFDIECPSCRVIESLDEWRTAEIKLICPSCHKSPQDESPLFIHRKLETIEDNDGERHTVYTFGSNCYIWKMEKKFVHFEQNVQTSTTPRPLPRIQYSDDEDDDDDDYFNYRTTAHFPFKKPKVPSSSEDAELRALLTKLKEGVRVFALDIECLTTSIRGNNRPDTNSNKAVLVSLYGDARPFPRVQIDRAWIQLEQVSGEIIRWNGYIIKSNGITRQLYESVRQKGKTLAQMREEIMSIADKSIILHHGPNDVEALGFTRDFVQSQGRNILFFNTHLIFKQKINNNLQPVSLRKLCIKFLGSDPQQSVHNPTVDAKALYKLAKETFIAKAREADCQPSDLKYKFDEPLPVPPDVKLIVNCLCHFTMRNNWCHCPCSRDENINPFNCLCSCRVCNTLNGVKIPSKVFTEQLYSHITKGTNSIEQMKEKYVNWRK